MTTNLEALFDLSPATQPSSAKGTWDLATGTAQMRVIAGAAALYRLMVSFGPPVEVSLEIKKPTKKKAA